MRGKAFTTEGIILGKKNYGEADKIVCLFSKDFGKLYLLAKSARLPKSRKRASLETFNHIRFQAVRSKSLPLIVETQTIDAFEEVKADLKKISVGYFFIEVVARLTQDEEKHEQLFYLLHSALQNLKQTSGLKRLRQDFIADVLIDLGFWPSQKPLMNHDAVLEEIAEKKFASVRIGRRVLS